MAFPKSGPFFFEKPGNRSKFRLSIVRIRNSRIKTLPAERPWSGWETGQGRTGNGLVSNPILTVRADPVCEETNRTGVIFLIPDMRVLKPPNKLIISVENIDLCKRNAKKRNPQKISYLELCRPGSSKA